MVAWFRLVQPCLNNFHTFTMIFLPSTLHLLIPCGHRNSSSFQEGRRWQKGVRSGRNYPDIWGYQMNSIRLPYHVSYGFIYRDHWVICIIMYISMIWQSKQYHAPISCCLRIPQRVSRSSHRTYDNAGPRRVKNQRRIGYPLVRMENDPFAVDFIR